MLIVDRAARVLIFSNSPLLLNGKRRVIGALPVVLTGAPTPRGCLHGPRGLALVPERSRPELPLPLVDWPPVLKGPAVGLNLV